LELRGNSITAHKHGRAQTLQILLFFLGKGSTVVVILSPLGRLVDMDCHPFFVFGKRRVGLLEIAEFVVSFGERGVLVSNVLNSAALARYCSAVNIDTAFLRQGGHTEFLVPTARPPPADHDLLNAECL